jgi:hypothetical protein
VGSLFGGLEAQDTSNYKVITSRAIIILYNDGTYASQIIGGYLYRDSGDSIISGGNIQMDPLRPSIPDIKTLAATLTNSIRASLATELGRIDATVSSRLAGTDFISSVGAMPSLSSIEGSNVLAKASDLANLHSCVSSLPTLANIESSSILAKASSITSIHTRISNLPTLVNIGLCSILANSYIVELPKDL